MIDFEPDYARLGKMISPPLGAKQVEESVRLLLEMGFLKKVDGRFVQTEPVLSTGYGIEAHQIVNFQIMMLKRAIEAFDRCKPYERITSATTFGISRKNYDKFVERLRAMRSELLELARTDENPQRVYELTLNLFPLSAAKDAR
jgi:uncharacterized protein (TIGR02147 family)